MDDRRLSESFSLRQGNNSVSQFLYGSGAYERDEASPVRIGKRSRPLSSSQVLISTIDGADTPHCPLLREFLRFIGKEKEIKENAPFKETRDEQDVDQSSVLQIATIDDPSHSTLTSGQHRRFSQLSDKMLQRPAPQVRREYNKLRVMVEAERDLYFEAVKTFWQEQHERLSTGFRGGRVSGFIDLALRRNATIQTWSTGLDLPTRFGKCCQIISLSPPSRPKQLGSPLDSVERKLVSKVTSLLGRPIEAGSEVSLPRKYAQYIEIHLHNDEDALQLAREQNVDILISDSTMELLIRADDVGSWFLPIVGVSSPGTAKELLVVGEPTITAFSSPRECLTRGFRRALVQEQIERSTTGTKISMGCGDHPPELNGVQYHYIVLTLPGMRHHPPRRVLVRRETMVCDDAGLSLRIHAHVEYFPERGHEIPNNSDKALWMLDYMLYPDSRVILARVDPSNCRLGMRDEMSLAHALTPGDAVLPDISADCTERWHKLLHLLSALQIVGPGKHLLCYPGYGIRNSAPSISVHELDESKGEFSVIDMLTNAGQVPLGLNSFRRCYRLWKWEQERVAYTFPIKKS